MLTYKVNMENPCSSVTGVDCKTFSRWQLVCIVWHNQTILLLISFFNTHISKLLFTKVFKSGTVTKCYEGQHIKIGSPEALCWYSSSQVIILSQLLPGGTPLILSLQLQGHINMAKKEFKTQRKSLTAAIKAVMLTQWNNEVPGHYSY